MASTSIFSSSFERLKALDAASRSSGLTTLTLPGRPMRSDSDARVYMDGAIAMLSDSTAFLYSDRLYLDNRLDKLDERVGRVVEKTDKLDKRIRDNFEYIQRQFKEVHQRIDDVKEDVRAVKADVRGVKHDISGFKDDVNQRFDDVNQRFDRAEAVRFNLLAKRLYDKIKGLGVPVKDRNDRVRYEVGRGFPKTVREFWFLEQDSKLRPSPQRL
jgi:tetrahydromethanopterin S-methyltransferase subunit G